jgi:pimeloyl-ACP methyl ester carboxylesterase
MTTPTQLAPPEIPVYLPGPDGDLFGILTAPSGAALGIGVIILPGGAPNMVAFGRNGVAVALAWRLAALGFHVMRFDYHGLGDSDGDVSEFRLTNPFIGDARVVAEWMESLGIQRFVLAGVCFGARTALAVSPEIEGLEAVVLSSMPLGDDPDVRRAAEWRMGRYLRRNLTVRKLRSLFDASRRKAFFSLVARRIRTAIRMATAPADEDHGVSRSVLSQLDALVDRRIPLLFMFAREDALLRDFREGQGGQLGAILRRAGQVVAVEDALDPLLHSLAALTAQDAYIDVTERWLRNVVKERTMSPLDETGK